MGEAVYYMKMRIKNKMSEKKKDKMMKEIKDFMLEGCAAYDFWQDNRCKGRGEFWAEFEKRFPNVSAMLKDEGLFGEDCNNNLAGQLDFGTPDDIEDTMSWRDGNTITYVAMVWHFATWDGIANYMQKRWNLSVSWLSDEYADLTDLL